VKIRSRSSLAIAITGSLLLVPDRVLASDHLHELFPADGAALDRFGHSVAIDGSLLVAGAIWHADTTSKAGAAYVFDASTGQELLKLVSSDGAPSDWFGVSVSIDGGRIAVGASEDDDHGGQSGSVYVFDAATGAELLKLTASDGEAVDRLGRVVAIHGNHVLAGASGDNHAGALSGSAYLFDATTGQQLHKLTADDAEANAWFGNSVAIHGNLALVGSYNDDEVSYAAGAAYLFDVSTGQQIFKWTAPDGHVQQFLGWSVAIDRDRAVVGAVLDDDHGVMTGAAYLFDPVTGQLIDKMAASNAHRGGFYAKSLSIGGGRCVVGAGTFDPGRAYLLEATTGHELLLQQPSNGVLGDDYGWAVGVSADYLVVGAPERNFVGTESGAVYVYALPSAPGIGFCTGDGTGTACPCSNPGSPDEGCANSGGSGARVSAIGSNGVAADDLFVVADGLRPAQPALLFAGEDVVAGGLGAPFGDGLRCAGGAVTRLGVQVPDVAGATGWGPGLSGVGGWNAGDDRHFQVWYRDPGGPCSSDFNLTGGLSVTFAP